MRGGVKKVQVALFTDACKAFAAMLGDECSATALRHVKLPNWLQTIPRFAFTIANHKPLTDLTLITGREQRNSTQ